MGDRRLAQHAGARARAVTLMVRILPSVIEPALRSSADPLAADLLKRMGAEAAEAPSAKATRPFSRRKALRVYQNKAAQGDRAPVRTEGYDRLFAALGAAPDEKVIVHGVTFSEAVYLVFTDPSRTQCVGVLRKVRISRGP
jgi:hypothetical protein